MKKTIIILTTAFFASMLSIAQSNPIDNAPFLQDNIKAGDSRVDSGGGFMGAGSGRYIQFSAKNSILIKQVEINANTTGIMEVQLLDINNAVLDSKKITLTKNGIQNINLDFTVPAGRGYKLNATNFSEGLKLYRNNLDVSYPYSNGPVDVIDSHTGYAFYYFFYNWKIEDSPVLDEGAIASL